VNFSLLSLLILGVIGVTSLFKRGRFLLARYHWRVFIASSLLLFSAAICQSIRLYQATYAHPIGRFFDIEYFIVFRVGVRIFAPYIISLLVSLLFMWLADRYNKKYGGRFFEEEEVQMGGISFLLVGHPGWIFYFPFVVIAYLLFHIYHGVMHGLGARLPVYYLWVPTAIFAILIIEYWISGTGVWALLKI